MDAGTAPRRQERSRIRRSRFAGTSGRPGHIITVPRKDFRFLPPRAGPFFDDPEGRVGDAFREIGGDEIRWYPVLAPVEPDEIRVLPRTAGHLADDMAGGAPHECRRELPLRDLQEVDIVDLEGDGGHALVRELQLAPEEPRRKFLYGK